MAALIDTSLWVDFTRDRGGLAASRAISGAACRMNTAETQTEKFDAALADKVHRLLEDNSVRYVAVDSLGEFIKEIESEAHF